MAQLINEARRMQLLAGLITELETGSGEDMIRVKMLEDRYFEDPTNKQKYAYKKGETHTVRAKYVKPAGANESIESTVNEALRKFRKGK